MMGGRDFNNTSTAAVWRSDPPNPCAEWTLVLAEAPWSRRYHHQAVVLRNDSILLAGGWGAEGALNDVWRSDNGGVNWNQVSSAAAWPSRFGFSMLMLPDGSIMVAGGRPHADGVWLSADEGATFTAVHPTPYVDLGSDQQAAVVDDAVFLSGGISAGGTDANARVYRSHDAGEVWTTVTETPGWEPRSRHAMSALPGGGLIVVGGFSDGGILSDVWVSFPAPALNGTAWYEDHCDVRRPALCTAPVGSVGVSVSIPAEVGTVSPPNIRVPPMLGAMTVLKPAVPTITLAATQPAVTSVNTLQFDVVFSTTVEHLHVDDFVVDAGQATIATRSLARQDQGWTLTLRVASQSVDTSACPHGYAKSPDGSLCGLAIESSDTWEAQATRCAPYHLARVSSTADLLFLASLRETDAEPYWYVTHGCAFVAAACVVDSWFRVDTGWGCRLRMLHTLSGWTARRLHLWLDHWMHRMFRPRRPHT